MSEQVEVINQIIELLPKLTIHTPTPELLEARKRLQKEIVRYELKSTFNQPMTEEEIENQKLVAEVVSRIKDKEINS